MAIDNHARTEIQNLRFATLSWGRNTTCAGHVVRLGRTNLACVSKASLETGCPVVLTVELDDFSHELLGRVTGCRPTGDGNYLVRLGMEYTDIETQSILQHLG
jgi:hypothetical protein